MACSTHALPRSPRVIAHQVVTNYTQASPGTRDDRRPVAGQDPGAGQKAPGRRRRRPQLPWLLSPELVSTSYATAEYGIADPVASKVDRPPTRSARATPNGWPPCTWPSPSARAPVVSGSSPGPPTPREATRSGLSERWEHGVREAPIQEASSCDPSPGHRRLIRLSLDPPTPEFLAAWSACGAGLNRVVGVLEHDPEVWRPV
jgi:hypothetical protein